MIDLRYHVYSLVAVFLALAVGMFIGQAFVPTSPVERQQSRMAQLNRLLQNMESDFATLRKEIVEQKGEIKTLENDIKRSDEFCQAIIPEIVKGRLPWRNVAVILTGDYGENITPVKTVLEEAGARVTSITTIKSREKLMDPAKAAEISSNCQMAADEEPCRSLMRAIAGGVVAGAYYDKLVKMRDMGILGLSGDYSRHNDCVVILGGADQKDTSAGIDIALVEEIRAVGTTVVGCEPVKAAISFIPAYKKAGIASVDNVDKPFGQMSLVCALAGEVASFGVKETADRLMPQTLSNR